MNDFVRENLDLSPLKVCIAVLLRVRFLRSTAGAVSELDLGRLDDVLVDIMAFSGAMPSHFQDVVAVLKRAEFDNTEQLLGIYRHAVSCLKLMHMHAI